MFFWQLFGNSQDGWCRCPLYKTVWYWINKFRQFTSYRYLEWNPFGHACVYPLLSIQWHELFSVSFFRSIFYIFCIPHYIYMTYYVHVILPRTTLLLTWEDSHDIMILPFQKHKIMWKIKQNVVQYCPLLHHLNFACNVTTSFSSSYIFENNCNT